MKQKFEIPRTPKIPEELLKKILEEEVIVFIGSGVSMLAGLASWKGLALSYLKQWRSAGGLNYDAYEKLKAVSKEDPLKLLTICSGALGRDTVEKKLESNLKKNLTDKDEKHILQIYGYIRDLKTGYVTTNYDNFLEEASLTQDTLSSKENDFLTKLQEEMTNIRLNQVDLDDKLDRPTNKIVYLHGKASGAKEGIANKIVLTLEDYLEHYRDIEKGNNGKTFLKNVFNKTFLFIGFGLGEFEIIQHIQKPSNNTNHYLLLDVSNYEKCIMEQYVKYYKILNIEPIFYNMSDKGYKQQEDIFKAWSYKVRKERIKNYENRMKTKKDIDNLIKIQRLKNGSFKFLNKEEQELLKILLTDEIALDNFLRESKNPRFLASLNGSNNENINIFAKGHIMSGSVWKNRSAFIGPAFYLEDLAERLQKENIPQVIKDEYIDHILSALKNIISGYTKENKKTDFVVAQLIVKIIKRLGLKYLNDDIFSFINSYIKDGYVYGIIWELLEVLKQLIDDKNYKVEQLILTIIKTIPNDSTNNNSHFYYLVGDFFVKKENINKLADFCSEDFILNIANSLSDIIKNNIVIEEKIEMSIQADNSIDVSIRDTSVKFNLPYVEFSEKQTTIYPIIEKSLKDYDSPKKQKQIEQILYFYTQIWEDLTYISYASLSDTPSFEKQESLLIYLLKEILQIRLQKNGIDNFDALYNKIVEKNNYFIFKRILLYCYGEGFEETRDILFELLNKEKALLFSNNFEAEIYNIMKKNVSMFTKPEIKKIENLIENGPYEETGWMDDCIKKKYKSDIYKKYWKQSQYAPLASIEPFKSKYNELRRETGIKEFFNFRDGGFHQVEYKSKFTDEYVLSIIKNNPLEFVKEIEDLDKNSPNKTIASIHDILCPEDIAKQLQRLSKNFPKDVTKALDALLPLRSLYVRHILYGLRETQDSQNILWPNIFKFIEIYIDKFLKVDQEKADIIGAFSDIVPSKSGAVFFDDKKAAELLHKFINQLLKTYRFKPPMCKKVPADYLNIVLNTPMGRTLEKLLILMINGNPQDIGNILELYDKLIQAKVVEAHVFLGVYFIYFYKSFQVWTKEKTDNLANKKRTQYWTMFFEGFIKSNTQSLDYYDCMHEHYKKAIQLYKKSVCVHFTDLLTQFFLAGKDTLDDKSLLGYCYSQSAFEILSKCIVHIFYRTKDEKTIPKAKELWSFLWDKIKIAAKDHLKKKFLTSMLYLIPALDKLDTDNYGRISKLYDVNPKVNEIPHIFSDLLYLANKPNNDENAVLYLGRIYKKIIVTMDYFTISDSHQKIIEMLVKQKSDDEVKRILDEIKNIYKNKNWNEYIEWFPN